MTSEGITADELERALKRVCARVGYDEKKQKKSIEKPQSALYADTEVTTSER